MVKVSIQYTGDKHCDLVHEPSQSKISTDAPKDNNGRGEAFSPTDLVAAALGSCILTTMAIFADKEKIDMTGAHASVTKEMKAGPRRIARLAAEVHMPAKLSATDRKRLEEAGTHCPLKYSLHPDLEIPVQFFYDV